MLDTQMASDVQRADDNAELRRTFEKEILPKLGKQPVRNVTDTELHDE